MRKPAKPAAPIPRPGGRTAQTRAAVFDAVEALLREKEPSNISMVEIAARAGVAATSLYRRWGDVRTLLAEVAVEQLNRDAPLPDTGSLRGDLRAWGRSVAKGLSNPQGSTIFRVYVATAPQAGEASEGRAQAITSRLKQIDAMLERARARGEPTPHVLEVTDHLMSPLYVRALFGTPADQKVVERLVDFLLDAVSARNKG